MAHPAHSRHRIRVLEAPGLLNASATAAPNTIEDLSDYSVRSLPRQLSLLAPTHSRLHLTECGPSLVRGAPIDSHMVARMEPVRAGVVDSRLLQPGCTDRASPVAAPRRSVVSGRKKMTESTVWLITGGGRGGSDIAQPALAAGYHVVATARDAANVTAALGEHDELLAV